LPEENLTFLIEGVQPGKDIEIEMIYKDYDGNEICKDLVVVTVIKADLIIHNGLEGYSGGQEISEQEEESKGAVTIANKNDTDGDTQEDINDDDVSVSGTNPPGRNELDLMNLILEEPKPDSIGIQKVRIRIISGDIKIYKDGPQGKEQSKSNGEATLTQSISAFQEDHNQNGNNDIKWWVEARSVSQDLRDIEIVYEINPENSTKWIECDRVKATAIWALCTETKHDNTDSYANWTDIPSNVQTRIDDSGGFGLRYSPDNRYKNVIAFQFIIYPSGIDAFSDVKFDLTREIHFLDVWDWDGLPDTTDSEAWPINIEEPNDDTHDTDESDAPSSQNHMYSVDRVGGGPQIKDDAFVELTSQNDYKEYMRVRFDGVKPSGESRHGSRCSSYKEWHACHNIIRDGAPAGGTVNTKRSTGDTNESVNVNDVGLNWVPVP